MPLKYVIDHERNLADVRAFGKVTLEDALHTIREVAVDVGHQQCGCLADIREMDFYPTVADLKEIAFEFIRLRASFRAGTSFIVSNDRHYALGRFLAMLVDTAGIRMAVFKDPGQAEVWLKTHTGAFRTAVVKRASKQGEQASPPA
jgi:hypothetical protein